MQTERTQASCAFVQLAWVLAVAEQILKFHVMVEKEDNGKMIRSLLSEYDKMLVSSNSVPQALMVVIYIFYWSINIYFIQNIRIWQYWLLYAYYIHYIFIQIFGSFSGGYLKKKKNNLHSFQCSSHLIAWKLQLYKKNKICQRIGQPGCKHNLFIGSYAGTFNTNLYNKIKLKR